MTTHDQVSLDVMDSLVQTSFTLMALLSQVAAEHDLSLTQLRLAAILRDREPTMSELAGHLGLERSSVSGLVDRAVRRGIVRRDVSNEDGRAVHVSLTDEGHSLAAQLTEQVADLIVPMTANLSDSERKRLTSLLLRVLG